MDTQGFAIDTLLAFPPKKADGQSIRKSGIFRLSVDQFRKYTAALEIGTTDWVAAAAYLGISAYQFRRWMSLGIETKKYPFFDFFVQTTQHKCVARASAENRVWAQRPDLYLKYRCRAEIDPFDGRVNEGWDEPKNERETRQDAAIAGDDGTTDRDGNPIIGQLLLDAGKSTQAVEFLAAIGYEGHITNAGSVNDDGSANNTIDEPDQHGTAGDGDGVGPEAHAPGTNGNGKIKRIDR